MKRLLFAFLAIGLLFPFIGASQETGGWSRPGPANPALSLPTLPGADGALEAGAMGQAAPISAELGFDVTGLVPGSGFTAILTLRHQPGWHSYGIDPESQGLPTTIEWTLPEGLSAGAIIWPTPERIDDRGVLSTGYTGTLELRVPMRATKNLALGKALDIGAKVTWLACKESCVPGGADFDFSLPVLQAAPTLTPALLLMLLGAFVGGLILNLMPCVLPVLSLKMHGLMLQAGMTRRQTLRNGLAYALGILLSFWAIAGLLALLSAGGQRLGWGFQFQEPGFVAAMAVFFFGFALNMLGVFDIGAGLSGRAASLAEKERRGEGLGRSLLSGVLATLTATPCSAPFMGTAIGFALSADFLAAFLVFSAMGLGLAAPILLLSAFPKLLARLPRAGRWTESLRQALGFGLLATVVWLLSLLAGGVALSALVPVLVALLGVGLGAWLLGRWGGYETKARARLIAGVLASLLFAASLGFAVLAAASARNGSPTQRAENAGGSVASPSTVTAVSEGIPWETFSPGLLADLRARNLPVFIDFTADWCLTCKANEAAVLSRERVVALFAKTGTRARKADWTRSDPVIGAALEGYGRRSVPLYVLYLPGEARPRILPEILTIGIIEKALAP